MLLFYCMANLLELIKELAPNQKEYIIRRIAGLNPKACRELVGIQQGTYNTWFHNETFAVIHRQLPDLVHNHRSEAIQILRRNNQLEAVLLEGQIVQKMKEEVSNGELNLCRTNLAREVYSKLISDLDAVPAIQNLTWQQRVRQIFLNPGQQPQGGEVIDGEFEAVNSEQTEHPQGDLLTDNHTEGVEETQT
jgi:hypothetical protein